jgi:hypothetical protein
MKTCFSLGSTFFFVSERLRRRSWKFSLGIDLHYPRWTGLQAKSRGVLMLGCHAHVSLVPHDQSQPSRPWSSGPPAWNSGATALLRSPCTPLSLSLPIKKRGKPTPRTCFFPSHKSNGQELASPDENCANGDGRRAYRRCPAYQRNLTKFNYF